MVSSHCVLHYFTMQLFLIIISALLWLWSRNDINKTLRPLVAMTLVLLYFRPLILHEFLYLYALDVWVTLLVKLFIGAVMGLVVLHMYTVLSPPLAV